MQLDSRATLYFMFRKTLLWVIAAAWLALLFAPGSSTAHPHPGMQWVPLYGMLSHRVPFLALLLAVDGFVCYLRTRAYSPSASRGSRSRRPSRCAMRSCGGCRSSDLIRTAAKRRSIQRPQCRVPDAIRALVAAFN